MEFYEGARSLMVIVAGNGYGNFSSSPGQGYLHFTSYSFGKIMQLFSRQLCVNSNFF